jgi:hypothetical protein
MFDVFILDSDVIQELEKYTAEVTARIIVEYVFTRKEFIQMKIFDFSMKSAYQGKNNIFW